MQLSPKQACFRAAVSSAGCGSLSSVYGAFDSYSGEIDGYGCQWVETGQVGIGSPWETSLSYLKNSPLFYLDKVETPLMMIGGEDDPMYQPKEIFVGLRRLGKMVRYISYEGERHTPRDEWSWCNKVDAAKKIQEWVLHWFSKSR